MSLVLRHWCHLLMDNTSEDQCIRSYAVTVFTVTGVTFLMDNTEKISASGLMYVTGYSHWFTFLMDKHQ